MNDLIVAVDRIHKRGKLFFLLSFFVFFLCSLFLFLFKPIMSSGNCEFLIPLLFLREFSVSSCFVGSIPLVSVVTILVGRYLNPQVIFAVTQPHVVKLRQLAVTPVGNTFTRVEIVFLAVPEKMPDNAVTLLDIFFLFRKFCIKENHNIIRPKPSVSVSTTLSLSYVLKIFSLLKISAFYLQHIKS